MSPKSSRGFILTPMSRTRRTDWRRISSAEMAHKHLRRTRRPNDFQDRDDAGDTQSRRGARPAIEPLRSRLFDLTWVFWTALFAPVIPLLWLAGAPPRPVRKVSRIWARGVLFQLA